MNRIDKQNSALFNKACRPMSDKDRTTFCDRFCKGGCRAFGGRERGELEQIANPLEEPWST